LIRVTTTGGLNPFRGPGSGLHRCPNAIRRHATSSIRYAGTQEPFRLDNRKRARAPASGGTIVAELEQLQTALMLARSGAGIVFVPGVLAHFKIGCIVFRPFMPANGQGIVYAVCPHGTTITLVAQFPASRARLRSPADAASARFWRIERCSRCTELPARGASNGKPSRIVFAGSAARQPHAECESAADWRQELRRVF
jgi:hypothetical protein